MGVPSWPETGIILKNILQLEDWGREWGKEGKHLAYNSDYTKFHLYLIPSNKINTKFTKVKYIYIYI